MDDTPAAPVSKIWFVLIGLLAIAAAVGYHHYHPDWMANQDHRTLEVSPFSVVPFVLLLLSIAVMPLLAEKFWHSNLSKALFSFTLGGAIVGYFYWVQQTTGQHALPVLGHAMVEYIDFIVLLAALYAVAGGIAVHGSIAPTPVANTLLLLVGAALANLVGTTGASMLLIRPLLRFNKNRVRNLHVPIFFIFAVSNLGGLLTPLGDPPLFLGFLNGVDFAWTFSLWPHWLVANGCVLGIFFVWDAVCWFREPGSTQVDNAGPIRVTGLINVVFLAGILLAVLLQSKTFFKPVADALESAGVDMTGVDSLKHPWPTLVMVLMAVWSMLFTRNETRQANEFSWGAIIEVAVLFFGIFLTMVPALVLLKHHGHQFDITHPWHFFWLTGALSSVLDNAPTYMVFAAFGAGPNKTLAEFSVDSPLLLQAISAGAVFMGAMTYIGNGPNFMVKSIAESMGYRMPSFFGYVVYSGLVLLPTFVLVTWLFFWV
jgi:Na+/H+ antiporter NhaD/arsenite permease-like protein